MKTSERFVRELKVLLILDWLNLDLNQVHLKLYQARHYFFKLELDIFLSCKCEIEKKNVKLNLELIVQGFK